MSRQVDKKYDDLDEKFANVLIISGYKKQADFAMECKINPGTLSKALERSSLSEDIVDKIYDRFGVRKGYWDDGKEPILERKSTPAMKSTDNKETAIRGHVYTDLIEHNSDYKLMPTMLLTDYSIIPKRILEGHEKEIARQDGLIAKYEGYINRLEKEIESLRSQLIPKNAQ